MKTVKTTIKQTKSSGTFPLSFDRLSYRAGVLLLRGRLMKRMITLPAIGKSVTIGNYVKGIKLAKANPNIEFKHGLTCWWSCTGRDIMRQFREGVQQRINEAIPYMNRGA